MKKTLSYRGDGVSNSPKSKMSFVVAKVIWDCAPSSAPVNTECKLMNEV